MDPGIVLALFDEQLRKHPLAEPGERIEAGERVTRRIAAADGWTGVIWSDHDEASAGPVIDAQIRRFAALGQPWEWNTTPTISPPTCRNGFVRLATTVPFRYPGTGS
jgi:hypothetical protein